MRGCFVERMCINVGGLVFVEIVAYVWVVKRQFGVVLSRKVPRYAEWSGCFGGAEGLSG